MGLAPARGLAAWADKWVQGLIAGQMDGQKILSTTLFVFPWWLWTGSVAFAVGVTTLVVLYPAGRPRRFTPSKRCATVEVISWLARWYRHRARSCTPAAPSRGPGRPRRSPSSSAG